MDTLLKALSLIPPYIRGRTPNHILIRHLEELSYGCQTDVEDDYSYIIVHNVKLPSGYNRSEISIAIMIPDDYPLSCPGVGASKIFIPKGIRYLGKKLKDVHDCYELDGDSNFVWMCYEEIQWNPSCDDLIDLVNMVTADLQNPLIENPETTPMGRVNSFSSSPFGQPAQGLPYISLFNNTVQPITSQGGNPWPKKY